MDYETLLGQVRSRTKSYGISTAAPFLRQVEQCLGGHCPSQLLKDVSEFRWKQALKTAERRLVYHDSQMGFDGDFTKAGGKTDLPPYTIATFPAVITTTRQDRDGDVLETKGADLDPGAPLLWQHLPFEPIGKLLKEGKHTSKLLTGDFSICGTALGEDAAMLAEHGALDISHGFTTDDYEPLDDKEYSIPGFHVLKFKILEVSLVSIPSNPDAEIQAFSRNKLHHPLVKAMAGMKYDARPVISAVGIDVAALANSLEAGTSVTLSKAVEPTAAVEMASEPVENKTPACGCHAKAQSAEGRRLPETAEEIEMVSKGHGCTIAACGHVVEQCRCHGGSLIREKLNHVCEECGKSGSKRLQALSTAKGVYVEFENSFDHIRCDLNDALLSHLMMNGEADADDFCYIVDLFLYQALVQVCPRSYYGYDYCYPSGDNQCYYLIDWEMGPDDEPVWSGAPQPVEITPTITALDKRAFEMFVKSLPAKHVRAMKKAMGQLSKVVDHEEATKALTDLASKASEAVQSVYDAQDEKSAGLPAEHVKKLDKAMGYCSKGAEHGDANDAIKGYFKSAGVHIKSVMDDGEMSGEESLESLIAKQVKSGRRVSAANEKRLKAAASAFKAVADDDEADGEVSSLASKGYQSIKGIFSTGGDSANDYDEDGNYTGAEMTQNTVGGESTNLPDGKAGHADEKAGRAVSKETAGKIQDAIGHGKSIIAHDKSTKDHKAFAKSAVKKLSAVIGETPHENGDDNSEILVTTDEQPSKSFAEVCEAGFRSALCDYALTGTLSALEGHASDLSEAGKNANDTISRIKRQHQFDAEEACVLDAAASVDSELNPNERLEGVSC